LEGATQISVTVKKIPKKMTSRTVAANVPLDIVFMAVLTVAVAINID
jgi:hypothetical protein